MKRAKSEEQKLVDYFNTVGGDALGRQGDYDELTPAETAIRAMRERKHLIGCIARLKSELSLIRDAARRRKRGGSTMKRYLINDLDFIEGYVDRALDLAGKYVP